MGGCCSTLLTDFNESTGGGIVSMGENQEMPDGNVEEKMGFNVVEACFVVEFKGIFIGLDFPEGDSLPIG